MTPTYQETTQDLTFVYHTPDYDIVLGATSCYDVTGRGHSNSFHCPLCQPLLFTELGWRENSNWA